MKKIYFISGLGTTEDSILDLDRELDRYGYKIKFIDIPGQYSNIDININNENDFIKWIEESIPVGSDLIAFSMGADLLLRYNKVVQANRIIILDGGMIGYDLMNTNLEEDIEETTNYIFEHKLDMKSDTIAELTRLIRKDYKDIFNVNLDTDTLLLLSDSPEFVFEYKKKKINDNIDRSDKIKVKFIENTSHQLFIDKPKEVAEEIVKWIKEEK